MTTTSSLSILDAINKRCSVRTYAEKPVGKTTVEQLLAAAVRAPTAMHVEPWAFVVVQNAALLKQISDAAKKLFVEQVEHAHADHGGNGLDAFRSPDFNLFYNAGTLVVICGKTSAGPFVPADCWLAAENLMLAACAMGLGTCAIGSAVAGLNTPSMKAQLGMGEDVEAIAPIIVGVPDEVKKPTSRKPPVILAWK